MTGDAEALRHEAALAISNIACGSQDQTNAIVAAGAIPPLLALLEPEHSTRVGEQALWAIGKTEG